MGVERTPPPPSVVSYPKSGRTWHRLLLGAYLCLDNGLPMDQALGFTREGTADGRPTPVAQYRHDGTSTLNALPDVPASSLEPAFDWSGAAVILLTRDVRDLLVSHYHHVRFRRQVFDGSLTEFVRGETFGVSRVISHYQRWAQQRSHTSRFLHVSYEELHADPAAVLVTTLRFLQLAPAKVEHVAAAVEFCRFENMQRLEQSQFFADKLLRTADPAVPESMKVRVGEVGGFRRYLSADDERFVTDYENRHGNPFRPA